MPTRYMQNVNPQGPLLRRERIRAEAAAAADTTPAA